MRTYIEKNFYIVEFNANELKTEKQFIDKFWEAFNIPNKKTYNLDALYDWMTDLSWLNENEYKIIINRYSHYSKDYNLDFIIREITAYKDFWNKKNVKFIIEVN